MNLAIFDLDNTLLAGDSDFLWGQFLVKKKCVNSDYYEAKNQQFYEQYKLGKLDINEFLRFSLKPLAAIKFTQLQILHKEFMSTEIIPLITQSAKKIIKQHKDQGDHLLIISATNLFVTKPIAHYLGISDIIATLAEIKNGEYSGKVEGIPSFQQGKVTRLDEWLIEHPQLSLQNSYFYSDSINDLPLLKKVTFPIAVDPDDKLKQYAKKNDWKIMSFLA